MPRSVNHVASRAKRKRILKLTRGYFGARKNVWTVAKNTWEKGLTYAYAEGLIHKAGIEINRKVLADLAMNNPAAFKAIVDEAKKHA